VLTIYSYEQYAHRPAYVVKQGERSKSFDMPERIDSILSAIHEQKLGPIIPPDDVGLEPILAVHETGMVEYLMTAYQRQNTDTRTSIPVFPTFFPPFGQRRKPRCFEGQKGYYCTNTAVPIDGSTWNAAMASAQCSIVGARHLQSGESLVYALCRPPGHHAGPDFFGGYCYLNNAAIAAQTLRKNGDRVAILDIDYHHGNGTQAIFYAEPDVGYASLHIDPNIDYPFFAGYEDEVGLGPGKGTNWNVPLANGTDPTRYMSALDSLLERLIAFNPQWLIVSAGFDTYVDDPIGTFQITTAGFEQIGQRIRTLNAPTLVVQEGGYCITDLGRNVAAFLKGLTDLGSRIEINRKALDHGQDAIT
jgi:acetoin utilization deacetylase AcuC-like enzyme